MSLATVLVHATGGPPPTAGHIFCTHDVWRWALLAQSGGRRWWAGVSAWLIVGLWWRGTALAPLVLGTDLAAVGIRERRAGRATETETSARWRRWADGPRTGSQTRQEGEGLTRHERYDAIWRPLHENTILLATLGWLNEDNRRGSVTSIKRRGLEIWGFPGVLLLGARWTPTCRRWGLCCLGCGRKGRCGGRRHGRSAWTRRRQPRHSAAPLRISGEDSSGACWHFQDLNELRRMQIRVEMRAYGPASDAWRPEIEHESQKNPLASISGPMRR